MPVVIELSLPLVGPCSCSGAGIGDLQVAHASGCKPVVSVRSEAVRGGGQWARTLPQGKLVLSTALAMLEMMLKLFEMNELLRRERVVARECCCRRDEQQGCKQAHGAHGCWSLELILRSLPFEIRLEMSTSSHGSGHRGRGQRVRKRVTMGEKAELSWSRVVSRGERGEREREQAKGHEKVS